MTDQSEYIWMLPLVHLLARLALKATRPACIITAKAKPLLRYFEAGSQGSKHRMRSCLLALSVSKKRTSKGGCSSESGKAVIPLSFKIFQDMRQQLLKLRAALLDDEVQVTQADLHDSFMRLFKFFPGTGSS